MQQSNRSVTRLDIKTVCITLVAIVILLALPSVALADATLTTDKADYSPGEVVQITGTGFHPNETVQLQVTATDGGPTWDGGAPWDVQTDQQGSFTSQWPVYEYSLGRTYLLTADCMHPVNSSDMTPHLQASATFTDQPPPTCSECFPSLKPGDIPSIGTATIDGVENDFPNEWTASDLFVHMYNAGDPTKDNTSDAYVKFVCNAAKTTATVYVFIKMNATLGYSLLQDPDCSTINNWIKVCDGSGSLVKATDSCLNSAPPAGSPAFAYVVVGTQTVGYEASFTLPAGATYNVVFHAEWIKSDASTGTSAGEGFPKNGTCMTLTCPECTPPVITCPPDKQLQCGDSTDPSNTGTATATGNCNPTISYSDVVGGGCTGKNITRTWKATNSAGQTATCVQHITFVDTTPPVITCPPDKFLQQGDPSDPSHTGTATATDNCGGTVVITYSDVVGGGCSGQDIARTWKATDPCGNVSTCVQHITFACPGCLPPVITCPPDIQLQCGQSTDPSNTGTATATGNCNLVISYSDVVGGGCNGNDVTRTWKAVNDAGQATCVQHITFPCCDHLFQVYQACRASSPCSCDTGYANRGVGGPVISSVPGILCIDPGGPTWPNFIGAAHATPTPIPYTIKNVTLVKQCPQFVQCSDVFPAKKICQQGTPNIRLWWPLMYETPSCTFTLSILYGTPVLWDDDGPGPHRPAWVHQEQWVWHVDADLPHLSLLLELFRELPFGLDEVPLVSDEVLYTSLQGKLAAAEAAFNAGDTATAAATLADFELEVMDACISDSPRYPNPTGPGTGIANTKENPACCKLLVDVEYILQTTGIGQPIKK